jgi:Arc/MetJ family transcription regulator
LIRLAVSERSLGSAYTDGALIDISVANLVIVTKRLIDIDDDVLERARAVSGATTIKDTVTIALQHLNDSALRRQHLDRLASAFGTDIADHEVMADAWR